MYIAPPDVEFAAQLPNLQLVSVAAEVVYIPPPSCASHDVKLHEERVSVEVE